MRMVDDVATCARFPREVFGLPVSRISFADLARGSRQYFGAPIFDFRPRVTHQSRLHSDPNLHPEITERYVRRPVAASRYYHILPDYGLKLYHVIIITRKKIVIFFIRTLSTGAVKLRF